MNWKIIQHDRMMAITWAGTVMVCLVGCSAQNSPAPDSAIANSTSPHASSQVERVNEPAAENSPGRTGASAMRAYIDPATGQLREPTPEDIAAEAAAEIARKKAAGARASKTNELREVVLPNGTVAVELGDSAQQPLIGCVQQDGNVKMEHECKADNLEAK